ncbi:MAG: alpha/beta fold hydrolase [Gemmatimonadetes bacterium]|nr:alpha/beta fold hydrolase [Gemmatimonadota bacterium]
MKEATSKDLFMKFGKSLLACLSAAMLSACAALTISQATPQAASPAVQAADAVFVMRYQGVPVSVETYARGRGRAAGTVAINEALEVSYEMDLTERQNASRVTWVAQRPDRPLSSKTTFTMQLAATPGAPPPESAASNAPKQAAVPYLDSSVGLVEQLVRHARAVGGSRVEVPVYRLIDGRVLSAVVTFPGENSAFADVGGKVWRLIIDAEGRVQSGQLTEYGLTIERRASVPLDVRPIWAPNETPQGASYSAMEVKVPTPEGHVLAGTLTLPNRRNGKVPAVLLITGSGKNSRNQGSPPSMPFRQIADVLTSRGIAVLRVDDRGVGSSTGDAESSTTQDEARDIQAAVSYIRSHPAVDPDRVGLVGWSEGGFIAPMVAAADPSIRAVALMNGGLSGQEAAEFQIRYAVEQDSSIPPEKKEEAIASTLRAQQNHTRAASIMGLDVSDLARQLRQPVLLLNGSNDRHVPPWSAARYVALIREGGNQDVSSHLYLGLNHVMLPDPDGRVGGFAFLPSMTVPQDVLDTLAGWLTNRLTK